MDKKQLKSIYLNKRKAIDQKEKMKLDDLLLIQFQKMGFSGVSQVLSYWPLLEQNEPNTLLFTSYLRHLLPGLQLSYPVSDFSNHTMQAMAIDADTVYHPNSRQIMEPEGGVYLPAEILDMVLVPLIICDQAGYRVGYGRGFYDRFLATCRPEVLKVGFTYFDPVSEIKGVHQFDLPLDYCITPHSIYEF